MQTTGVVQQKGGVGKSGLSVGVAGALAERGRRVLLADVDPQGHASAVALKIPRIPQDRPSLAAWLAGDWDGPVRDLVVRHSTTPAGGCIDVLPTSLRMFTAARDLDKRPDRERQLGRLLQELAGFYDEALLDSPPALDILTDNVIAASDGLLIPVQPDDTSIEALRILFGQIRALERALRRPPARLHGLVPGMFRRPLSLIDQSVMAELHKINDIPVLAELPLAAVVKEAWRAGTPVPLFERAVETHSAAAYRAVADVLDRAAGRVIDGEVVRA
ncbi:ParA family protein [Saccharopolyspora sp. NPDC000359]|uniref:ParA family protein n=1 Tax=Saccharopolyspora sp. NPDC000359 TaxID=3154251 RepID=UPI00331FFD97